MTDTERAVIEAAEKCRDANRTVDLDNAMCVLIDAVDAHRAAPKLVRCPDSRCRAESCTHKRNHTQRPECTDSALDPDCPNCAPIEPVEEPMVPEREARRREREAFLQGWLWTDRINLDDDTGAETEAARRYPDNDTDLQPCTRHDGEGCSYYTNTGRCEHGVTCHEDDSVDAGPSLESRVADLERKEKAHWARLNDFDRRVTDLENDLRGLENAHITLGGIVSEEIKKWAKK